VSIGIPRAEGAITGTGRDARPDLTTAAAAGLAAAAVAAAILAVEAFDHGAWLVAYLFLVGFLAQLLLGRGQVALLSSSNEPLPEPRSRRTQLVLWNAGVITVPFGVLADARIAVVFGSVVLVVALASFFRSVRAAIAHPSVLRGLGRGYIALLVFMAGSVLVGTALAWDIPWL
jgi:hypothetical protein